jgi:signal transduction histidine kinase
MAFRFKLLVSWGLILLVSAIIFVAVQPAMFWLVAAWLICMVLVAIVLDRLLVVPLERENSQLLADASHRLKTPLTSLVLQLHLSKRVIDREGAPGLERVNESLGFCLGQLDRMTKLIDAISEKDRVAS